MFIQPQAKTNIILTYLFYLPLSLPNLKPFGESVMPCSQWNGPVNKPEWFSNISYYPLVKPCSRLSLCKNIPFHFCCLDLNEWGLERNNSEACYTFICAAWMCPDETSEVWKQPSMLCAVSGWLIEMGMADGAASFPVYVGCKCTNPSSNEGFVLSCHADIGSGHFTLKTGQLAPTPRAPHSDSFMCRCFVCGKMQHHHG